MATLVTGCAGFIGFHTCTRLLQDGVTVLGVDNFSGPAEIELKRARLVMLDEHPEFVFNHVDIASSGALQDLFGSRTVEAVINLAGQAGLRTSFDQAEAHVRDNFLAHLKCLEFSRDCGVRCLVHASTSAVYGDGDSALMSECDPVANPISIYAATKRGAELLSAAWSAQYRLPITSLRFFNVYGPWGRPDSAPWIFTDCILNDRPINLHGFGNMRRSFIHVDDVVSGILASIARMISAKHQSSSLHTIYNIGGRCSDSIERMVDILESALGRSAQRVHVDAQPGELMVTDADLRAAERDLGFSPSTSLDEGLSQFVHWFREYHGLA